MRITRTKPKFGDTRTVTKFLLWPMVINDEMRWLERATYRQVWSQIVMDDECDYLWVDECWVD